jgi:polar amino acid transport system substrate-binding protein
MLIADMFKLIPSVLLFCLPLLAYSVENEPINLTVGYIHFPPFTYTNDNGNADGLLFNKAKKVIAQAGYQINTIALPTQRLKKYISTGDIDLWLGIKPPKAIEDHVLVSTQPLSSIQLNIYSTTAESVTSIAELSGKKLIVIRGYNYGGLIEDINDKNNNIIVHVTQNHESAIHMLRNQRAEYLLAYQRPISLLLETLSIDNLTVNNLSNFPVFFILSKHVNKASKVMSTLDNTLKNMNRNK